MAGGSDGRLVRGACRLPSRWRFLQPHGVTGATGFRPARLREGGGHDAGPQQAQVTQGDQGACEISLIKLYGPSCLGWDRASLLPRSCWGPFLGGQTRLQPACRQHLS